MGHGYTHNKGEKWWWLWSWREAAAVRGDIVSGSGKDKDMSSTDGLATLRSLSRSGVQTMSSEVDMDD